MVFKGFYVYIPPMNVKNDISPPTLLRRNTNGNTRNQNRIGRSLDGSGEAGLPDVSYQDVSGDPNRRQSKHALLQNSQCDGGNRIPAVRRSGRRFLGNPRRVRSIPSCRQKQQEQDAEA